MITNDNLAGRVAVITGGNSGIGRATAAELLRRGADVVFTARDEVRGRQTVAELKQLTGREPTCLPLDLESLTSVRELAERIRERHTRIHLLINNAGLVLSERRETPEGFEATFAINHLGHFALTALLLDLLKEGSPARVVNVASEAHRRAVGGLDFEDLQSRRRYNGWLAYCRSKLANIYFTRELARRLDGSGVVVNAVHPGVVATGFGRHGDTRGLLRWAVALARPFMKSEAEGARPSVFAATAPELEQVSGAYLVNCRQVAPSAPARDDVAARRLWTASEEYVARGQP